MPEQPEELYRIPEWVEWLILVLRINDATRDAGTRLDRGLRSVKEIIDGLIGKPEMD